MVFSRCGFRVFPLLSVSCAMVMVLVAMSGCGDSGVVANGCGADQPCTNPQKPFCDLSGAYPESNGVPNVCIAEPPTGDDAGVDVSTDNITAQDGDVGAESASEEDASLATSPHVRFTVDEVQFDGVATGSTSAPTTHTIKNHGDGQTGNLSIQIVGENADQFRIDEDNCSGLILDPNAFCTISTVFVPTAVAEATAFLQVVVSEDEIASTKLTGVGLRPGELTVSTTSHTFNGIKASTLSTEEKSITISNGGESETSGLSVRLDDVDNFSLRSNTCATALPVGASCEIRVGFDPKTVAVFETKLRITANGELNHVVTLRGTGLAELTVTKRGKGVGTISDGSSINCGTRCTALFEPGTAVKVTAMSGGSSAFAAWSGNCAVNGSSCTVKLDTHQTVQAEFVPTWTVTVKIDGPETAQVVVKGGASDKTCTRGTCTYSFIDGTRVQLVRNTAERSPFKNWSGACSGDETCSFTVGANKSVTAHFETLFRLTVELQCLYRCDSFEHVHTLEDSIRKDDKRYPSISCKLTSPGWACTALYAKGMRIGLMYNQSLTTDHWSGCDSTYFEPGACENCPTDCVVEMTSDKIVRFERWPGAVY